MIKKAAKILPYCVVMWATKQFSAKYIETSQLGACMGFRIDKGEWVLFSEQNYARMREKERKQRKAKLDKKKEKLMKKLRKDFSLRQELKKEFESEKRREEDE